ncbi:NF038122 family metalloprotease [Phenylobacterium montanum]|uniref:NF038122 family metalloprotease n=1 Tax=Phenylobacterium montanum TaxID=2823693 RepID=A0A975IV02_9CAUL|nr:NF038122 family metalloprotease [Caulobacter sp. S6]QUD88290.1 NF038122 family metalloprotease [Caulobacter sp. S6]
MQINWIAGANYGSAPSWLPTVLAQVANFYDSVFTNNVTLNIRVNWENLGSGVLASNSNGGPGDTSGVNVSFSTLSSALIAHETTNTQASAYSHLPGGVGTVYVSPSEAQMLGLEGGSTTQVDLYVGSGADWSTYDAFAAIAHEVSETAMGRISTVDSTPSVMDMFRFNGAGSHDLSAGNSLSNTTAYFSVDNGATKLGTWNNDAGAGYDLGDWCVADFPDLGDPDGDPVWNDAMGAQEGGVGPISEVDIELMNALGWSTSIVTSGNIRNVSSGQTLTGWTVMSGGEMVVRAGAVVSNTTFTLARAFDDGVLETGLAGAAILGSIAGTAVGASVVGGTVQVVAGGVTIGAKISGGGAEYVQSGGSESGTVVLSGAHDAVYAGGQATGTVISSGGFENINSGGAATGTLVSNGGAEYALSGGSIANVTVVSGGHDTVSGSATSTTVSSGGFEAVSAHGVATSTTVLGGGYQYVNSGATSINTTVQAGARQTVSSGGVASSTTVAGAQYLSGGTALGATVTSGGVQYVDPGATASGTNVKSGGHDSIYAGGRASGTNVSAGAYEVINSGGVSVNAVISGGALYVNSGAVASGAAISSGGHDTVYAGGQTSGTVIFSAAFETVSSAAVAVGAVINAGGHEYVLSGGTTSGATVASGGVLSISSGGVVAGGLTLGGGTANVSGVLGAGQTVTFQGSGGLLDIANPSAFGAIISGFVLGDTIDLPSFTYSAGTESATWSQTGTSGTLTITDGALVANLTLSGSYVTSNFKLSADSTGGTLINDPPVQAAQNVTLFTQHLAGLNSSPGPFAGSTVSSGGGASALAFALTHPEIRA